MAGTDLEIRSFGVTGNEKLESDMLTADYWSILRDLLF